MAELPPVSWLRVSYLRLPLDINGAAIAQGRVPACRIIEKQGATSDRVLAHVESYRANIVDARVVYVAISRARKLATLYTDDRADLTEALGIRDGAQVGAIDEAVKVPEVATATPAPVRAAGTTIGG